MYKPTEPISCPKCGTTVNVNTSMILTSNPPCYEWICPNCGKKGYTKQDDIITFENQTKRATLPYIQKVAEPDLGVGGTTTNIEGITAIGVAPAWAARCIICGEEFKFDSAHRVCPKCREAIVKLRETADNTANPTPVTKSTVTDPKSTACDIPRKPILQQGWECPKCGAILAPNQHYCPFCSPSEYGRSNWLVTTPAVVPSRQYTNPNPSTAISLGDKPKKSASTCVFVPTNTENDIKLTI